MTHGVIAHEVYHSVNYILNYCGVDFSHSSEEAYSHLLHYLIDAVYMELKSRKIKIITVH